MKKDLIVVDFDKTLIPYDSFKKYCLLWIGKEPLEMAWLLALRKLRIISSAVLKRKVVSLAERNKNFSNINREFAEKLLAAINPEILSKINIHKTENAIVLLLSASPDIYISMVGAALGFQAKGSFFNGTTFVHLRDIGKQNYLRQHYSREFYHYKYAVSDCVSDSLMLSDFQYSDLIK